MAFNKDFIHRLITGQLDEAPKEPDEYEFIRLLKKQEERKTAVSPTSHSKGKRPSHHRRQKPHGR